LDRLDLSSALLADIVEGAHSPALDRHDLLTLVGAYRKNAFSQYLNSISTVRTWDEIYTHFPETSKGEQSRRAVTLAFILRDLRNWLFHSPPGPGVLNQVTESVLKCFTATASATSELRFPVIDETAKRAMEHVFHLENVTDEKSADVKSDDPYPYWFLRFSLYQRNSNLDDWFDNWLKLKSDRSDTFSALTSRVQQCLLEQAKDTGETGWNNWWRGADSVEPETVFVRLLAASSVAQLAKTIGSDMVSTARLVTAVRNKCNDLLAERVEPSQEQGSSIPKDLSR
jgi:hypothetical protein